jgi:hypothetical protein
LRYPRRRACGVSILSGHPDQGETLAKRWCTGCHLVAGDQKNATTEAPPFDPHPKMPNMELSRDEASDIAAYIKTLR